jgi:hypothetical protein
MSFTPFFFLFSLLIPLYHTETTKIIGRNSYFKENCILPQPDNRGMVGPAGKAGSSLKVRNIRVSVKGISSRRARISQLVDRSKVVSGILFCSIRERLRPSPDS